jgi:hypothetical protein
VEYKCETFILERKQRCWPEPVTRLLEVISHNLRLMGEPDGFISKFLDQLAMIRAAPRPHIVFVALVAGGIWWAMDWKYSTDIVHLKSTIDSRDAEIRLVTTQRDDYKEKLGGASPDQAKARMDALEKRLTQFEPRRLPHEQRTKLISVLRRMPNIPIEVRFEGTCADCNQYANDFNVVFSAAGWPTLLISAFGITGSPKGLTVFIYDIDNVAPEGALLTQSLESANVPFDPVHRPKPKLSVGTPAPNITMFITVRITP